MWSTPSWRKAQDVARSALELLHEPRATMSVCLSLRPADCERVRTVGGLGLGRMPSLLLVVDILRRSELTVGRQAYSPARAKASGLALSLVIGPKIRMSSCPPTAMSSDADAVRLGVHLIRTHFGQLTAVSGSSAFPRLGFLTD